MHILTSGSRNYTLKFSDDISHFQEEVLADQLYSVLGLATPQFIVLNNYAQLSREIQSLIQKTPFVRIAEFILKDEITAADHKNLLQKHFEESFVLDAFMANRDANKKGNNVLHAGIIYRIDNGGSLRNRSVGKKKGAKRSDLWDPYLIPELKSLIKFNPLLYINVTENMIREQAKVLLSKATNAVNAFKDLAAAIAMETEERDFLGEMLSGRFHLLEMLVHPGTSYPADLNRPVTALSGAGTFLICNKEENTPHVLLGARRSSHASHDGAWVTLGGKGDSGQDRNFPEIASRELYEETMGLIVMRKDYENASFHDFVHEDYFYRQYFVFIEHCLDAEGILSAEPPHSLRHNENLGRKEYHAMKWFPVSQLRNITAEGRFGTLGEHTAYQAFSALLHVNRVQTILKAVSERTAFPEPRFAQSMSRKGTVDAEYGTFLSLAI